jgi:sugar-specific transcriptional regulator TrmB
LKNAKVASSDVAGFLEPCCSGELIQRSKFKSAITIHEGCHYKQNLYDSNQNSPHQERRVIAFDDEDAQTLVKLGLNSSQAKIYLTLVSLGVAKAKRIAQNAKIDSGELYRQLEHLQEKGLVEKIVSNPTEYKPMPLSDAIRTLIQRKNVENIETRQKAEAMIRKATYFDMREDGHESTFSIIPPDDFRKIYCTRVLSSAVKEVAWYTPAERIPAATTYYSEAWTKAFARGVHHRVIAELDKPTEGLLEFVNEYERKNPSFEIRYVEPTLLAHFSVFDETELIFSIERVTGVADSQMLRTNNAQLIKMAKEYFELKWKIVAKECSIGK